jgi:hypothetical protein
MIASQTPITIIDDFFDDPFFVREFALSQTFSENKENYPGFRTKKLHVLNPDMFNLFCGKLFSTWYDITSVSLNWVVSVQFQKIPKLPQTNSLNIPWIHQDSAYLGGIVYLNLEEKEESGTTLYSLNEGVCLQQKSKEMKSLEKIKQEILSGGSPMTVEEMKKINEINNKDFTPTVKVSSKFNRLVCFGSEVWHAQSSFGDWEEDRLTLCFFVESVSGSGIKSPLQRGRDIRLR